MRIGRARRSVPVALLLAWACASDGILGPPAGLPHAVATPSCGPDDAPSVAIILTAQAIDAPSPPPPFVSITIWQSVGHVAGQTWTLAGGEAQGGAVHFMTRDQFEFASSGQVRIVRVGSDTTVEGSVDVRFPSGFHVRGGFRARWLPSSGLCG